MTDVLRKGWLARDLAKASKRAREWSIPHPMFLEEYVPGQKRPRRSEAIAFNVTPAFKEMLERMAWEQHTSLSHLVRCLVERGGLELLRDEVNAEKGGSNERD